MNKKTHITKLFGYMDKRWTIQGKKHLSDFDAAIDATMEDVSKYIDKHAFKIISRLGFSVVHDGNNFTNKAEQQFKISMIEFKETIKLVFKSSLERCVPIQIIYNVLECVLDAKFIVMTLDTKQVNVPPRGSTLKIIK